MAAKRKFIGFAIVAVFITSLLTINGFAERQKCDINADGYVNAKDALILLVMSMNNVFISECDVNGDGYVNAKDALFVLRLTLDLSDSQASKPISSESQSVASESKPASSEIESMPPKNEQVDESSALEMETTSSVDKNTTFVDKLSDAKEDNVDNYEWKWAYNILSDNLKKAYAAIYDGAINGSSSVDVSSLDIGIDDIKKVFWSCDYDNPQLLNIADGYAFNYLGSKVHSVAIMYGRDITQTKAILKNIEALTANVIKEARELTNDYKRLKLFHDWIIDNTVYVIKGKAHISEIDGPVIHGEALCEGYSKTFAYLCQSVGIPCVCVHGHGNGGDHMWNMVQLDGRWYHVDVTWDDPITTTGEQVRRYTYFLLSDAQISSNHVMGNEFVAPLAPNVYGT